MAKTENNGKKTSAVKMTKAGEEVLQKVLTLYNLQAFVREGKNLREELAISAIAACSHLAAADTLIERRARIDEINAAVVQLNRLYYVANSMFALGLYTAKQASPVLAVTRGLLASLKNLLASIPESHKVIRVKTPLNVVNAPAGQQGEQPSYEGYEEVADDLFVNLPDGFDDPV